MQRYDFYLVASSKKCYLCRKFLIMTKHELTDKQIAALRKLGVKGLSFYKRHIPVSAYNIYITQSTKLLNQLSIAIATDVYTSEFGRARIRTCYDYLRKPNKWAMSENVEVYIRQLNERVQYYLAILLDLY